MRFEDYFSFEAIVGDLIRWRLRGKERKGVNPAVLRKQSILRMVRRVCGGAAGVRALPCGGRRIGRRAGDSAP